MTGRQPLSPIDAQLGTQRGSAAESYESHLDRLVELKKEISKIARENDGISKVKRQAGYDKGTKGTVIKPGDYGGGGCGTRCGQIR